MGKKHLISLLKILVSAFVIYTIVQKINYPKLKNYLTNINYFFIAPAILAFFISKIIAAFRLNLFYKSNNLILSHSLNIKLYLLSMYYALFIPGIGGDGFKIYWLNKTYKFNIKDSFWTAFIDRVSGLIALTVLLTVFFIQSSFHLPFKNWLILLIPLLYLSFYFTLHFFFKSYKAIFWSTNLYSILVQILQVGCSYCILCALGCNESIIEYLLIFLVSCYAYLIPIIGIREALFIIGAQWFGLNTELSAAASIFFYACLAITSLIGIYFFFFPEKLHPQEGNLLSPIKAQ